MSAENEGGGIPELVTFPEIARRLNAANILSRPITRAGVRHIADTDPEWPVPQETWIKAGRTWLVPWAPVEEFFRNRPRRGRGPGTPTPDS